MKGVFFRSDTRTPYGPDQMFANGFAKRDATILTPQLRHVAGPTNAPDIEPASAVCVTRYFEAAPLFPVGNLMTNSWVYLLDLDTSLMTNTQLLQWNYVQSIGQGGNAQALWPMFGQERAMDGIGSGDIIGAVEVQRQFPANNVFAGGNFKPLIYTANPFYDGPGTTATMAANLIAPLINAAQWISMPAQAQGIVQSTGQ
ncbi:MAG: hypothetical protein ACYDD1_14195 [Caulobacteraceae bacterium]